ncbi:hypothetical protein COB52_03665 [Candidatus Kaiserbacteria bacterium]|nr:MAG: hypothetical protein COB52_03665 [Candidatus Kaiserbacteria bacterium]
MENGDPPFYVKQVGPHLDLKPLLRDLNIISQKYKFPNERQLCLTHRKGIVDSREQLYEGAGRLKDGLSEFDYLYFNTVFVGTSFEKIFLGLSKEWEIGRMRIALLPSHSCYSMHDDHEDYRTHLALKTNSHVYIFYENGKSFHIPADGFFYDMYTGENHTVFNAGPCDRIHLLMDIRERKPLTEVCDV